MADVQLEKGYIRIANNLFYQLFLRKFTSKQKNIILLIMAMSYGFNKKDAAIIPKSRFDCAGIHRQDINIELEKLIQKNVLYITNNNTYCLNKNYDTWKIPFHKNFNEDRFTLLLRKQFCKQNTNNDVSETLTKEDVEENNVSKSPTNLCVNHLQIIENCKQNTNNDVSETLTKEENLCVNHLQTQAENTDNEQETDIPKNIFKDNIKNISLDTSIQQKPKQKLDPFINPVKDFFTQTYKEIFKVNRVDLSNAHCLKIVELNECVENFVETIPETLNKLKNVDFDLPNFTANYTWLLKDDNYITVLAGTYDKKLSKQDQMFENLKKELGYTND